MITGQIVDTNSAWLSARLLEYGTLTYSHITVADDQFAIVQAVRAAAGQADLVLITGGLGPTRDDLTREALAEVGKTKLVLRREALANIERFFRERGRSMPVGNRKQALAPLGAAILENPCGTAPGLALRSGQAQIMAFPGVPAEMQAMFDLHVAPKLAAQSANFVLTAKLNSFGLGESVVGAKLGALMRRDRNPLVGTTVAQGIVSVRIRCEAADCACARAKLGRTMSAIKRRLGDAVFSENETSLAEVVGSLLKARRWTVATAESCTAGTLAALLTAPPGASAWFLGGWITYANVCKTSMLGVPPILIKREGAVSEAVARRMAQAALHRAASDYALAITGIAGPDGGSSGKPVGTVWIAMAQRAGACVKAERLQLPGSREVVRERAAKAALDMLRLELARVVGARCISQKHRPNSDCRHENKT